MIVASMLLVIVGAVTLVVGIFTNQLQLVYVSIVSCLLAAVFLGVGIVRGRPSRKPALSAGGDQASWSGAAASWGGGGEPLEREPEPGRGGVQVVAGDAAAGPAETDDDIVVVPKRTAGAAGRGGKKATRKAATRKATKKAAAKKATKKAAAKKATKKAAAKKATKKAAAKKVAAKKTAPAASTAEADLAEVSGLGPAKRKALLDHFGSEAALRAASVRQLTEVQGVSDTLARRVKRALR